MSGNAANLNTVITKGFNEIFTTDIDAKEKIANDDPRLIQFNRFLDSVIKIGKQDHGLSKSQSLTEVSSSIKSNKNLDNTLLLVALTQAIKDKKDEHINFVNHNLSDKLRVNADELRKLTDVMDVNIKAGVAADKDYAKATSADVQEDFSFHMKTIGEEISEVTVSVQSGVVASKEINLDFPITSLAIVYDTTGIHSYKTTLSSSGCVSCGRNDSRSSGFITISSKEIESPYVKNTLSSKNETSGLQVDYSIVCDPSLWLCSIRTELGLAMLYRTAYELLAYSLNSGGQFSNQKVTNSERNQERLTLFEYNYGQQLEKFLKSVKFPTGRCFECFRSITTVNRLPG